MARDKRSYTHIIGADASERAQDALNTLVNETGAQEDIVIVDDTLAERERQKAIEQTTVPEVPEVQDGTETGETPPDAPLEPLVILSKDALKEAQVLDVVSARETVRVLFCTQNRSLLEAGSFAQRRLLELSGIFAEMHVILLGASPTTDAPQTVRLVDNVWVYATGDRPWWRRSYDAYRLGVSQLSFAGGFRADIIVAEDPFEAGLTATWLAKKFDRPLQVHVLEDIFSEDYGERFGYTFIEMLFPHYVLSRATCARTNSAFVKEKLIAAYDDLAAVTEVLPSYYNLTTWRDLTPAFDLKARYPQFKFIILHVSSMMMSAHSAEVIQAAAPLLRTYPTIGLVILGNGPLRSALEKLVIELGIGARVEFEPMPDELVSHMKSAQVLVHLSENTEEDLVILQAACAKLPIIAGSQNIARTLFVDGESAFLCPSADPACVESRLKDFLNGAYIRTQLAMNAHEIVFERIEQDYYAYLRQYKQSIEHCAPEENEVA